MGGNEGLFGNGSYISCVCECGPGFGRFLSSTHMTPVYKYKYSIVHIRCEPGDHHPPNRAVGGRGQCSIPKGWEPSVAISPSGPESGSLITYDPMWFGPPSLGVRRGSKVTRGPCSVSCTCIMDSFAGPQSHSRGFRDRSGRVYTGCWEIEKPCSLLGCV